VINEINQQLAAQGKGPFQWKTVPQGAATSGVGGCGGAGDEIGGDIAKLPRWYDRWRTKQPSPPSAKAYVDMHSMQNRRGALEKSEEMVGESF